MTVAENIWLSREPQKWGGIVDRGQIREKTDALLDLFTGTYKSSLRPEVTVASLPSDEKQIVEILKAVSFDPKLLILDEATASLDSRQVERLFEMVVHWKQNGKAIIFVSHRMEEIFRIADRYSVLRNGKTVGSGEMKEVKTKDIVALMVGDKSAESVVERKKKTQQNSLNRKMQLEVSDLSAEGLKGVSLKLHEGELLGIGGLKGQGQRSLLHTLFGDLVSTGTIKFDGALVKFKNPRQAMNNGVALVPGERAKEGLLFIRSILENLLLPSWGNYGFPTHIRDAQKSASDVSSSLSLKMAGLDEPVSGLSGGNAQKVVIGKWLLRNPRLLLLDDPTKGVDVGTKAEFYSLLTKLCADGVSVLFYSSDDEELLALCDRILVMHDGLIRTELAGESLTKSNLVAASLGASQESMQ